jgi:hypothetical protein
MRKQAKSGSDQRRKRRLAAKATAKQAKPNGNGKGKGASDFVTRKEMNEGFQTYAQNLQKLGALFNENQKALRNAFELVDAHQGVLRRIAEDYRWNRVRPTPLHEEDVAYLETNPTFEELQRHGWMSVWGQSIDYQWYFGQYNFTLCIIAMAQSIRKFLGLDESEEQKPEAQTEEQEPDFNFGGDYGEQNQIDGDAG